MSSEVRAEDHEPALYALKQHVSAMSDLAVRMVADGTRALVERDDALATAVTSRDVALDKFDVELETETMRLIAVIQPEGSELRMLGATLKIANCLDRVGRLGFDLARNLSTGPIPKDKSHLDLLREMDRHARAMVQQATHAFVVGDAEEARRVFAMDDDVDALYVEVEKRVIELLEPGGLTAQRLVNEILSARHLERVGDNACKIAEKAIYAITGERRTEYFPALAHRTPSGRIIP